ncbi:MAG: Rpp14/Pop5 family protein [Nanoarchaeota archaeon]|nr:Rpp14/Pop5 family protein [Nanoarchaeota archaeon]
MKNLKPSMRENKRYLLIKGSNLRENIEKAILDFIGSLGMSKAGLEFVETNRDSAIIGINRESLNHVRASLVAFPERMQVVRVSGTLRALREK